ncbi:MAG: TIGR02285 family protein [Burkholderiaceae bacterium]|nr:TIGR02285 family protein [Burkholderiaceae bacterium]
MSCSRPPVPRTKHAPSSRRLMLLAGLGLALAGPVGARPDTAPAKLIEWNVSDWPPFFVFQQGQLPVTAQDLGAGAIDGFLRLVIARLPQYQHRFVSMTGARAEVERKAGRGLCSPSSMRTPERLKERFFTPAMPTLPLQLVLRRERLPVIAGGKASVSLQQLTRRDDVQGLVMSKRQYGQALAQWVRPAPDSNIRSLVAPRAGNLLAMLAAGRMDYTLEYPMIVEYHQRQQGRTGDLVTLPIDELGEPPLGYFSCTRNAWGKAVIADIDGALRQVARLPEARQVYGPWMSEALRAGHQERIDRFFEQRARGGPMIE